MPIGRKLLAIIGRRLPAIHDVIPHGPLFARGSSTLSRSRRPCWVPPSPTSSCAPPGSRNTSGSIQPLRTRTSTTGAPLERRN